MKLSRRGFLLGATASAVALSPLGLLAAEPVVTKSSWIDFPPLWKPENYPPTPHLESPSEETLEELIARVRLRNQNNAVIALNRAQTILGGSLL